MSLVLAGLVVVFFSVLGFWRPNPVLFMLAAGASLIVGLYWFDTFTTNMGLAVGILLVSFALVCVGFAYRCIFWRDRLREE